MKWCIVCYAVSDGKRWHEASTEEMLILKINGEAAVCTSCARKQSHQSGWTLGQPGFDVPQNGTVSIAERSL